MISRPLTAWMGASDKTKLVWNDAMNDSFHKLKKAMAEDVNLTYPDYDPAAARLELSTDACQYGAGACLTQLQWGERWVIAYASTTFNKAQCNYCTIEQELAAIQWAVKVFRGFLLGVAFTLFTDHRPLVYMHNMASCKSRILRTRNDLADYNFQVVYKPGKENGIADTLSRLHLGISQETVEVEKCALPEGLHLLRLVQGGRDSMVLSLLAILQHHQETYDSTINLPADARELRLLLVEELRKNPGRYNLAPGNTTRTMLKLVGLAGQLSGDEFLLTFVYCFDLQLWIHHGMVKPVIYCKASDPVIQ